MLNANMPEEFYVWMSNLKQILTPLLERAMDLLQAVQWAVGSRGGLQKLFSISDGLKMSS